LKNLPTVDQGFPAEGILQTAIHPQQAGYAREPFPVRAL
jgi:hypothetical protein